MARWNFSSVTIWDCVKISTSMLNIRRGRTYVDYIDQATAGEIPLEPWRHAPIRAYLVLRASWSRVLINTSGDSFPAERLMPRWVKCSVGATSSSQSFHLCCAPGVGERLLGYTETVVFVGLIL